jgi:hypothetical protein
MPFAVPPGQEPKSKARPRPDAWDIEAKRFVKAELARREITFKQLERLLRDSPGDDNISAQALAGRINRGTFTFAFALRVLDAIGANALDLRNLTVRDK